METIIELYNKAFDEHGNPRVCGRETCKDLIKALNTKFPYVNFGDSNTGFMNVTIINEYINKLN